MRPRLGHLYSIISATTFCWLKQTTGSPNSEWRADLMVQLCIYIAMGMSTRGIENWGYFCNLPHLSMPKSYNGDRHGGRKDKVKITWPNSHLVMWIVTATGFPCPHALKEEVIRGALIPVSSSSFTPTYSEVNVIKGFCMPCGRQGSDHWVEIQDLLRRHKARRKLKKLALNILNKDPIDDVAYPPPTGLHYW